MSMHVDNFEAIRPLLVFDGASYYFVELVLRKKDFPEGWCGNDHVTLGRYFITSESQFTALEPEIKALCHLNNARAYINLDRKPFKRTALLLMQACLDMVENDDYHKLFSRLDSAAGKCTGVKDGRFFLLDLDLKEGADREEATRLLMDTIKAVGPGVEIDVKAVLPTPNGVHVVTSPFDKRALMWCEIARHGAEIVEIKHNSPTVLYYGGYGQGAGDEDKEHGGDGGREE